MIPLLTADEMRRADDHAIRVLGVPARALMETAGRACAVEVQRHAGTPARIGVVCGTGNNGGDGLVVARVLHQQGYRVGALVLGEERSLTPDALANLHSAVAAGVRVHHVMDPAAVRNAVVALQDCALVVDAVFGTGLTRAVTGRFAAAIDAMNAGPPVLAVDLPSGLNADTGATLGTGVQARWTVALGCRKRAHALVPGRDSCGDITVVDIGIPVPAVGVCTGFSLEDGRAWHTARVLGAHKGSAGHVLVVGGSPGMTGAAVLACRGALRAGAGRVTALRLPHADPVLPPEVTTCAMTPEALAGYVKDHRIQSLVVGPGLSVDKAGRRWLASALGTGLPAVLDAGALAMLAGALGKLEGRAGLVLTPHPAELGRLLGVLTADVMADRIGAAERAAREAGAVVVHKGAGTVVATPTDGSGVCMQGHPVLATGGTGDVLAGIIGALLAKGLPPYNAARLGVLLHARAGERLAESMGPKGVLASEIADGVPGVFAELERG